MILTLNYLLMGLMPIYSTAEIQSNVFTRIGIEEGPSPGDVNDIIQGSLGFIWIGTESCLSRYDGYNFKIFKNQISDGNSISYNYFFTIHKDRIMFCG